MNFSETATMARDKENVDHLHATRALLWARKRRAN